MRSQESSREATVKNVNPCGLQGKADGGISKTHFCFEEVGVCVCVPLFLPSTGIKGLYHQAQFSTRSEQETSKAKL